jgi:hypothetical protein
MRNFEFLQKVDDYEKKEKKYVVNFAIFGMCVGCTVASGGPRV